MQCLHQNGKMVEEKKAEKNAGESMEAAGESKEGGGGAETAEDQVMDCCVWMCH
jgi:hypothetical protein